MRSETLRLQHEQDMIREKKLERIETRLSRTSCCFTLLATSSGSVRMILDTDPEAEDGATKDSNSPESKMYSHQNLNTTNHLPSAHLAGSSRTIQTGRPGWCQ
ncbi:hypothetical protein FRB91_000946 [Serendipita sp. 411]|nr:hypothetical protein FRB91_000946 [Serendipita sp. 411]